MARHHRLLLLASSLASALVARPALAQTGEPKGAPAAAAETASGSEVDALIVTARRQSERAVDVPIAMSVVSGASLQRTGVYTLTDLQTQTPSLVAYQSNPRNSSLGIRGIGVSSAADGLDTSVGVYVDDVYLGRPGMALDDLIDIDQLEVLRGPQGTLFGRNSSAGVLNITTQKPNFSYSGTAEASVGNFGYNQERLSVTGPVADGLLAFRLTAYNTHRDGDLPNTTTNIAGNSVGRDGVRLQFLATPTPKVSVRLIGEYSSENDTCCVSALKQVVPGATVNALAATGYIPTANLGSTANNSPQNMLTDQYAFSAEVNWDLGWGDLTSVTAQRYWHFDPLQDSDGTPLDVIQVNVAQTRDWQYSQELRLASKPGRFNWQAGVYLFNQNLEDHYILNQFGRDASAFYTNYLRITNPAHAPVSIAAGSQYIGDTHVTTDSAAAFGQANFELTDRLTLTGGVRYTYDDKHGLTNSSTVGTPYAATSLPIHDDVSVQDNNTSYLVSAAYKFRTDSLVYVSYSTGYKSAALNLNAAVSAGTPLVLQPEDVRDWEAGIKSTLLNHRLRLNVDGFWTNLAGLQANIYPTNGAKSYLANVGTILARGVEADASYVVIEGLELSANGSYNDSHYISYPNAPCPVGVTGVCNLNGRPVYESPKWIANVTASYHFNWGEHLQPYALAQYAYRSSVFGTVDDGPLTRIAAYGLVNARIGSKIDNGRYDLSIWVANATDARYFQNLGTSSIPGAGTFGIAGQLGTPRTYGTTLRASF
jgi:iron complex outermembrane recepter protein